VSLTARLKEDTNAAMRAGDKARLSVLRFALAAIKQREVDSRTTLDDAGVVAVLEKLIKQGRESVAQYQSGGRDDLVAKESAEIAILESYLPARLSAADLDALIAEVIRDTGAASVKDMGKVMSAIKTKAAGRVDMSAVNARVRALLGTG
jgi:uncharacterized protein YqeY